MYVQFKWLSRETSSNKQTDRQTGKLIPEKNKTKKKKQRAKKDTFVTNLVLKRLLLCLIWMLFMSSHMMAFTVSKNWRTWTLRVSCIPMFSFLNSIYRISCIKSCVGWNIYIQPMSFIVISSRETFWLLHRVL